MYMVVPSFPLSLPSTLSLVQIRKSEHFFVRTTFVEMTARQQTIPATSNIVHWGTLWSLRNRGTSIFAVGIKMPTRCVGTKQRQLDRFVFFIGDRFIFLRGFGTVPNHGGPNSTSRSVWSFGRWPHGYIVDLWNFSSAVTNQGG